MFTVIYSFKVKANCHEQFIKAWEDMTKLIYQYEGSLGSRLHRPQGNEYIAYAQWPDRDTWVNSGNKLPPEAMQVRQAMRASCEAIATLYELDVHTDLLKPSINP